MSRSLVFVKFYEWQLQPLSIFSSVWLPTCIFRSTYYIEKKTTYLVAQQGCFLICFILSEIDFIYIGQNTILICFSNVFFWIVKHCLLLGSYQVQLSFWDTQSSPFGRDGDILWTMTSRGHYFSKWVTSHGHSQRVTFRGHFWLSKLGIILG